MGCWVSGRLIRNSAQNVFKKEGEELFKSGYVPQKFESHLGYDPEDEVKQQLSPIEERPNVNNIK